MTAPGNLFDNIYKSPTQRSTTGNLFDNIYTPQETEEERKRREAEEARRQELFRGAGASGTFEEPTLSDRAKRMGEQAKRLGSILETRTTAGATDLAANLAGLARRVRVPGAATAETMLRGTALQQRQQVQPETVTEALAALAGESVAPVASAYATGGFLTSIGRGAGPLASAARAIAGPEKLSGSMLQRTGQVLRRGVGGTAVAAPLVTVPGAIAGGQQSTTASLSQMLDALAERPRTELAPDAGILERAGRAVGEVVEEPARRALGTLAETAPGRIAGDVLTDFLFGTVPEIGFRGGRMAVREGTAATRRGASKVSDLIADRLNLRKPPVEDAAAIEARKLAEQEAEAAAAKAAEEQARREAQRAAEERLMAEPPSAISQAMRGFQREMQGYGPRALEIPAREVPQAPSVRQAIEEMRAPFVGQARAEREIAENAARLEAEREAYRQTVRETREGQLAGLGRQAMAAEQAAADQLVAPTTAQQRALEALRSPRGRAALAGIAQAGVGAGVGMGLGETPEEKAFLAMTLAGVPAAGRNLPAREDLFARPLLPAETRSFGPPGFIEKPEGYTAASNILGELEHRNNVRRIVQEANIGNLFENTTQSPGLGLFDDVSPNTITRWTPDTDDATVRRTASILGLIEGQESQLPVRAARPDDPIMPADGLSGKTLGVVVTGPDSGSLSREQADELLRLAKNNGVAGGTFDEQNGRLYFVNVRGFTGQTDEQFHNVLKQTLVDAGDAIPAKLETGDLYAEYLDGVSRYLSVLGDNVADVRVARDLLDRIAPEYERFAASIGANVERTRDRLAATRDLLDGRIDAVEREAGPLGQMQRELAGVKEEGVEIAAQRAQQDTAARLKQRRDRGPVDLSTGTPAQRSLRVAKLGLDDLRQAVSRFGKDASEWYSKQGQQASAQMQALEPRLRGAPEKRFIANVILALTSSGATVENNLARAMPIIRQWLDTGQITQLDAYRGMARTDKGEIARPFASQFPAPEGALRAAGEEPQKVGERLIRPRTGIWPENLKGSTRAAAIEPGLRKLQLFLDANGGDEKAVRDFFRKTYNINEEDVPRSADVFGPKVGRFLMNVEGQGGEVTVDSWALRTWMRWMGYGDEARMTFDKDAVTPKNPQGIVLRGGPTPEENAEIREAFTKLADQISKETGEKFEPADVQALLWYWEKFNYGKWGSKSELESFADVGNRFVMAGREPMPQASNVAGKPYTFKFGKGKVASGLERKETREYLAERGAPFRTYDIGGAAGEALRRLASTEAGKRALVKTGVIGAGELVETAGEGEDGSPFLRATGKGMKALGAASLVYPTMKRGAVAGGTRVRDALAQSPQGRFILNSISRDILADPRVKELVEIAVDEQARYNAVSRQLAAEAQRLGPVGERLVSDIVEQQAFENAQMSPDDMAAVIAIANRIADAVEGMGAEKVSQRLISPATYEKGRRTYLRRDYARYAGEAAMQETPAGARKAPFRLETMKQRLDLTPEQRNELGEIREASYKVAQTIGRGGKDIATARLFNALADLPGMVEPQYKAALDEMLIAKGLRDAARETGDDVAAKDAARAYLEAKGRLKQVSDEFKKNPSEYVTMPDTPNLGVLRGAVVRRDVADYVNGVDDFGDTTSIFKQLNQIWKKVKTVYNASTHFGNFMSNIGVAHVKGLPIQLQPYYLKLAADALDPNIKFAVGRTIAGGAVGGMLGDTPAERAQYALAGAAAAGAGPEVLRRTGVLKSQKRPIKYDPDVQFLTESGLLGSSLPFYGNLPMQGLTEDRTALRALAGTTRPETRTVLAEQGIKPMGRAEQVAREADTRITRAYALEDGIFRVALFKRFKDQGLDNAQALAKLKESFPSYDTRSPILKAVRNFYSPFVMFSAKYIPMMLDGIMQHPERWVTLAAIWGGVNELSRRQYGEVRPEDLPANQRDYNYLIPGRIQVDAITRPAFKALGIDVPEGDKYTFDVARWTPFSAITGSPAPGMIASQLDLGGLPIPAIAQPGGPIVDVAALAFGVDPFTGEKILQPGMSGTEQLEAIAGQAASIATPSMLSFQIPRILKDLERGDDAAAAVDALSLVGLRPQVVKRGLQGIREKKKYEDAVRGIRMRYKVEMRKNRDPERRKELQEEAMRGLLREAQKYKAIMQPEMP